MISFYLYAATSIFGMLPFFVYAATYLLLGFLFVVFNPKYIRSTYKDDLSLKPFWRGFWYGIYQCGCIILFPVLIMDYFKKLN